MNTHTDSRVRSAKLKLVVASVAIVIAAAGVAACSSSTTKTSAPTTTTSRAIDTQNIAYTQTACQQWLGVVTGTTVPAQSWCDNFGHWMTTQLTTRHMTGPAMWGSPQALTATCRSWAGTQPTHPIPWCAPMVAWMSHNVGTWSDWQHWNDHLRVGITHNACQQWLGGVTGTTVPARWCDDMSHWMTTQITTGHMTGPAMWANAKAMTTACRTWAATQPTHPVRWCAPMVVWMSHNVGTWNNWQHWNNHMHVAVTNAVCQKWLNSYTTATGVVPTRHWCDDMSHWMTTQITTGHMTGPAMWGSPQTFTTACRNWAKTGPTGSTQWCNQMVSWMSHNVGTWNNWQDWNNHMGSGNTGTTYPNNHNGSGHNGNTGTTYPNNHMGSGNTGTTYPNNHNGSGHNGNTSTTYPNNHMGSGNTGTTYPNNHNGSGHNGNTSTTYPYNHMGGGSSGSTSTTKPSGHMM